MGYIAMYGSARPVLTGDHNQNPKTKFWFGFGFGQTDKKVIQTVFGKT